MKQILKAAEFYKCAGSAMSVRVGPLGHQLLEKIYVHSYTLIKNMHSYTLIKIYGHTDSILTD